MNRNTRRHVLRAAGSAASAASAAAFVACGQQTGQSGGAEAPKAALKAGATVRWGTETRDARDQLRRRQKAMFEQQFPNLKLELVVGGDDLTKIKAGIAAGTPLDLVRMS